MHHFELHQFMEKNDLVLSIFKSNRSNMWVAALEKSFAHGLTMKAVNDVCKDDTGPTTLGLLRACSFYPIVWAVEPAKAMVFLQETIFNYKDDLAKLARVVEEVSGWLHQYVATDKDGTNMDKMLKSLPATLEDMPSPVVH